MEMLKRANELTEIVTNYSNAVKNNDIVGIYEFLNTDSKLTDILVTDKSELGELLTPNLVNFIESVKNRVTGKPVLTCNIDEENKDIIYVKIGDWYGSEDILKLNSVTLDIEELEPDLFKYLNLYSLEGREYLIHQLEEEIRSEGVKESDKTRVIGELKTEFKEIKEVIKEKQANLDELETEYERKFLKGNLSSQIDSLIEEINALESSRDDISRKIDEYKKELIQEVKEGSDKLEDDYRMRDLKVSLIFYNAMLDELNNSKFRDNADAKGVGVVKYFYAWIKESLVEDYKSNLGGVK